MSPTGKWGVATAALDEVLLLAWASFSSRKAVARHLSSAPAFMALLGEGPQRKAFWQLPNLSGVRPLDEAALVALNQCGGRRPHGQKAFLPHGHIFGRGTRRKNPFPLRMLMRQLKT